MYSVNLIEDPTGGFVGVCDFPKLVIMGRDAMDIKKKMVDAIIGYYEAFPEDLEEQIKLF